MFALVFLVHRAEDFSMSPAEIQQFVDFVMAHKWPAFASLVIALVVRLLKSDTKIPIDIPPKYRTLAALGLGVVSGVLDAVATSKPIVPALLQGVVSALAAIGSHDLFIGAIRGGRELVVPGLIKPGVAPGPGKPVSLTPKDMTPEEKAAAITALPPPAASLFPVTHDDDITNDGDDPK